ncbi:ComEA family DNA-binding protein [Glaciihabitans arcticus]|uniref:ComEA family DNA-binding protein n=1 Tax=Glaciihabitans arcticus TaxID=2668039 RepID=A0A4Q9GS80_9MICO|nr:ComEA family DNA-binding protein [Glaciihabitans arcticus]TBN56984.1 ComEA family DNA-binding protein [Glaciihabitans arcticus]
MGVVARNLEKRARLRIAVGGAVVLLVVGLGCAVLFSSLSSAGSTSVVTPGDSPSSDPVVSSAIYVHVLGAVSHAGLYALREGDRAVDAVAAAGGFADDADQAGLNLARFVSDGEQIVVPVVGAAPAVAAPGTTVAGKVNLNTADAAALETLPRVGPALAARILEWRETNGRFTAIEDLLSVTGIGDKTFEGLKELVSV